MHGSARKHGVSEEDMLHAVTQALASYPLDDGDEEGPVRELWVGPDRAGNPLELVVLWLDDGRALLIHAMKLRRKYWEI